jgi:hypothetical protein
VAYRTGVTNFGSTVTVYVLTAPFPSFDAAALTTYWLLATRPFAYEFDILRVGPRHRRRRDVISRRSS